MDPLEMADSDLYQHLLNVESEHNIAPRAQNHCIFGAYSYSNYSLNNLPSNLSTSSLSKTTNTTTSSTTSISSLSNVSDDHDDMVHFPQIPESYIIDGGLQRALVIMVPDPTQKPKHFTALHKAIRCQYNDELTISEEPGDTQHTKDAITTATNTFSFKSWMQSYRKQPHHVLANSRRRRARHKKKLNKRMKQHIIIANKEKLLYITNLRNDLPFNPHKIRQIIRCKHIIRTEDLLNITDIEQGIYGLDRIEAIQQKIIALETQLQGVKSIERMKQQINNWKRFKVNWRYWRLIDLYEYLMRIKGRKYALYLVNFEVFYTQWMDVYDLDQKSSNQRFATHIFSGKLLVYIDHNDLMMFGINAKEDRREILMNIQQLNKY